MYNENSFLAFYRDCVVNFLGVVPFEGIKLALYEHCISAYVHRFMANGIDNCSGKAINVHTSTFFIPTLAGVSSACGVLAIYPANLVRAKFRDAYWS